MPLIKFVREDKSVEMNPASQMPPPGWIEEANPVSQAQGETADCYGSAC